MQFNGAATSAYTNVDRVLPPLRKPHSVGVLADAFFSCSTDHPPIIEAIVR